VYRKAAGRFEFRNYLKNLPHSTNATHETLKVVTKAFDENHSRQDRKGGKKTST
jgi:hypothetical protein